MIVFPNAKINLGLFVTSKRPNGYHNLETVFVPVKGFCDILEVLTASKSSADIFNNSGLQIDGKPQDNLCLKAVNLLRKRADIPPLNIHLHKVIPFGAGLGGGSADAAFMLTLLNEQYHLNFSLEQLESLASELGADCAVFVRNQPVLAKGIGNEFSHIDAGVLSGLWIRLVIPPIHVPTSLAYKNVKPTEPSTPLNELVSMPMKDWKSAITNDFEESVFSRHTEIKVIKDQLYQQGALYASMSGSGSAVYGLFSSEPSETSWPENYTVYNGIL